MFNQTLYNLQDGQDNVINIAEATGLPSLCMVKSSRPVDRHLGGAKEHKMTRDGCKGGIGMPAEPFFPKVRNKIIVDLNK